VLLKGLSGGERKRTCIGYELITDPKLLLLDEPTSGLDSTTAYKIIRILKKEASRGLTIVSTIHQPSSEIFTLFDRLILLHEGNIMYYGPVKEISGYLSKIGLQLPKFKNPADFIIKMVQKPESIKADLTLTFLSSQYNS
jgi:ABC-type multidrug transport system ATPase subunit